MPIALPSIEPPQGMTEAQFIAAWLGEEPVPKGTPFMHEEDVLDAEGDLTGAKVWVQDMSDRDFVKYRCAELINGHFHKLQMRAAEKAARMPQDDLMPGAPGRAP